jgi:hypothetical protein
MNSSASKYLYFCVILFLFLMKLSARDVLFGWAVVIGFVVACFCFVFMNMSNMFTVFCRS